MFGIGLPDVPLILGTVLTLVVLEGLLSADNALVLAVMVRHLPRDEQRRALRYGSGGPSSSGRSPFCSPPCS